MENTKKSAESKGSSSPRKAARELQKQPSQRANCLCSPTTHAGSFRCRHHRGSLRRNSSSFSTVADLPNKASVDDNLSRRMELEVELTQTLNEWNDEFVKEKYHLEEYKQKYNHKTKKLKMLEVELTDCKTELANIITAASLKNQQIDRLQIKLVEAQATITQLLQDQKVSREKATLLEAKNKKFRTLINEKEAALSGLESSRVIEDFKKSIAFKTIIQDHLEEARDYIYDVEVKALEQQCIDEGFTRGFLKGVRLVQRKTGVEIDGLTISQVSEDPSSDLDGVEIESEQRNAFSSDDEFTNIE